MLWYPSGIGLGAMVFLVRVASLCPARQTSIRRALLAASNSNCSDDGPRREGQGDALMRAEGVPNRAHELDYGIAAELIGEVRRIVQIELRLHKNIAVNVELGAGRGMKLKVISV